MPLPLDQHNGANIPAKQNPLPSASPLVKGETKTSPFKKGRLRGIFNRFAKSHSS